MDFLKTIPIQTIFTGAGGICVPNWNVCQALGVLPKFLRFKIISNPKIGHSDETGCQVKYPSLGMHNHHTGNCLWSILCGFVVPGGEQKGSSRIHTHTSTVLSAQTAGSGLPSSSQLDINHLSRNCKWATRHSKL